MKINLFPRDLSEDTAPKQLGNHNARNRRPASTEILRGACTGAKICRTGTKYMRIIYP